MHLRSGLAPAFQAALLILCPVCAAAGTPFQVVTGSGSSSNVKAFDGSTPTTSFLAYDPSFLGGVRVAAGDINGDGTADIIVAPGPNSGAQIKAFSGTDLAPLGNFFAYDPTFTGGVFVAAGDINASGSDDIITGTDAGVAPQVKAFKGASGIASLSFFAFDPAFTGGVRVAAGDINGDGHADIIAGTGPGAAQVRVFSGADQTPLAAFDAYPGFAGGIFVAAGDVNGDGLADIITGTDTGSSQIKVFSGADDSLLYSFLAYSPNFIGGVRVAAGDVNNDGFADIVAAPGPGSASDIRIFSGKDGGLIGDYPAYAPTFVDGAYVAAVPEPGTAWLLLAGIATLLRRPNCSRSPARRP